MTTREQFERHFDTLDTGNQVATIAGLAILSAVESERASEGQKNDVFNAALNFHRAQSSFDLLLFVTEHFARYREEGRADAFGGFLARGLQAVQDERLKFCDRVKALVEMLRDLEPAEPAR